MSHGSWQRKLDVSRSRKSPQTLSSLLQLICSSAGLAATKRHTVLLRDHGHLRDESQESSPQNSSRSTARFARRDAPPAHPTL